MQTRQTTPRHLSVFLMLALIIILPAGCNSNTGVPAGASVPAAAAGGDAGAAPRDVSGEFFGTINDSVFGTGQASAELSQYQNDAGGVLTFTYGSTAFITPASFLVNGTKLTGTSNFSISASSGICTFSEKATYKSGRLSGSYQVLNSCSGDHGTYTMKQQCRFSQRLGTGINFALKPC